MIEYFILNYEIIFIPSLTLKKKLIIVEILFLLAIVKHLKVFKL